MKKYIGNQIVDTHHMELVAQNNEESPWSSDGQLLEEILQSDDLYFIHVTVPNGEKPCTQSLELIGNGSSDALLELAESPEWCDNPDLIRVVERIMTERAAEVIDDFKTLWRRLPARVAADLTSEYHFWERFRNPCEVGFNVKLEHRPYAFNYGLTVCNTVAYTEVNVCDPILISERLGVLMTETLKDRISRLVLAMPHSEVYALAADLGVGYTVLADEVACAVYESEELIAQLESRSRRI